MKKYGREVEGLSPRPAMLECPKWMKAIAFSLGTATPLMRIERPEGEVPTPDGGHAALLGRPQRSDIAHVVAEVQGGSGGQEVLPVLATPPEALPVLAAPLEALPVLAMPVPVLAIPLAPPAALPLPAEPLVGATLPDDPAVPELVPPALPDPAPPPSS